MDLDLFNMDIDFLRADSDCINAVKYLNSMAIL